MTSSATPITIAHGEHWPSSSSFGVEASRTRISKNLLDQGRQYLTTSSIEVALPVTTIS